MEMEMKNIKAHVLVLSYPATGHTNPMLQFSKNIASRGLLVTFVTFSYNHRKVIGAKESLQRLKLPIQFECIPDDLPQDHTLDSNISNVVFDYMNKSMDGSGLEQLIHRLNARGNAPPVCCIVYNPFLPWARQVAKKLNIPHAMFWTQCAAVFCIYLHFSKPEETWDSKQMPESGTVAIPGLPELKLGDLPSAFTNTVQKLQHYLEQMDGLSDESWVLANTFYELEAETIDFTPISGCRKILHSEGLRFLDKAAIVTENDAVEVIGKPKSPWRLCTVTQVEEVKCILRLLPIWLCTIIYSVVFTQMASLFVEQGAAMNTSLGSFNVPAAAMSMFDIFSVAVWIALYRRVLVPLGFKVTGNPKGFSELQRMGVGLIVGMLAMVAAAIVEDFRLKGVDNKIEADSPSSLSIFWQIPQYALIGASEVFMYVGQLEFFNSQAPDALRSFGSAMCMTSISFGNYVSSLLVTIVMYITRKEDRPGWIPGNLNKGHMDRFYLLLAALTSIDFVAYVFCSRSYNNIAVYKEYNEDEELAQIK